MTSCLLQCRWDKIKDEIEALKPYVRNDFSLIKKLRKLKDEASTIRFAIERKKLQHMPEDLIIELMEQDRKFYARMRGDCA